MVLNRHGLLFVVSAPSGAGKTTLCREMIHSIPHLASSVSYTTRSPRKGEVHGREYFFISKEDFQEKTRKGEFAEWAEVHGNLYGTHAAQLRQTLDKGMDVLLDIDTQGATNLKKRFKEGILIFILPPSVDALRERLNERGLDSPEEISRRLKQVEREIQKLDQYNYCIINDNLNFAKRELESLIFTERIRLRPDDSKIIQRNFFQNHPSREKEE